MASGRSCPRPSRMFVAVPLRVLALFAASTKKRLEL
jgi:hypothetical protein